jgi:hypothetical protein
VFVAVTVLAQAFNVVFVDAAMSTAMNLVVTLERAALSAPGALPLLGLEYL